MKKKTLKHQQNSPKITLLEREVLHALTKEFLTIKQIAKRRETSVQNIYQAKDRLVKKGYLNRLDFTALKKAPPVTKVKGVWRYHGLHFLVSPYYFYPRYFRHLSSYGVQFGDWVFKFHKKLVEVQSKALVEFVDKDKFRAVKKAEASFNRALLMAGNRFGFEVFKEGRASIRLVNHHLAFGESDVAKGSGDSYLRIRCVEGKTWFLIDMSKGFLEHEYVDDVVFDSERLETFFNDVRSGKWSDMKEMVLLMSGEYAKNISLHLKVLKDMERTLSKIDKKL